MCKMILRISCTRSKFEHCCVTVWSPMKPRIKQWESKISWAKARGWNIIVNGDISSVFALKSSVPQRNYTGISRAPHSNIWHWHRHEPQYHIILCRWCKNKYENHINRGFGKARMRGKRRLCRIYRLTTKSRVKTSRDFTRYAQDYHERLLELHLYCIERRERYMITYEDKVNVWKKMCKTFKLHNR